MFDRAMAIQLVDIQDREALGVSLARGAECKGAEEVGEGVAEESEKAGGGCVVVLEVGGRGEELADGDADAEDGHGGFELRGEDVAAVAGDVAVVGEGVDDGAGTTEVGGESGVVVAFAEEEGAGFGGGGGFGHCWLGVG